MSNQLAEALSLAKEYAEDAKEFPSGWWSMVRRLVRRVEAHHGIKEKTNG